MSSQHQGDNLGRASWTPERHKLFIDLCVKQIKKGYRHKTTLSQQGWNELNQEFSKKTGAKYEKKQLKNHWDMTKDSWNTWHKLISDVGDGWDPIAQELNVSDDFWNDYLKRNKCATRFRRKKLLHCQELDYIFGTETPNGDFQWMPNSDLVPTDEDGPVYPSVQSIQDDLTLDDLPLQYSSDVGNMAQSTPIQDATPAPQGAKRKFSDASKIENMLERLIESVESKSGTPTQDAEAVDKVYTIKDCVNLLNQMADLPIGSQLYLDALDIFKKKSNREFFVSIPPEVRLTWLQRQTQS